MQPQPESFADHDQPFVVPIGEQVATQAFGQIRIS
jgi:hypothetical protein